MLNKLKENYVDIFQEYPLLIKLAFISLFAEIGYSSIIPTLPLYFTSELKASVSLFGWVIASYAFTETALKIPFGYLADNLGRKIFIIIGCIVPGFAIFFCIFVKNPYYFIPLWGLVGIAAASLWPNLIARVSEIVSEEKRGQALAVFNTAYMIGLCIGPPLGVFVNKIWKFEKIDFHLSIFIISSLFFISAGLITIFLFPEKKSEIKLNLKLNFINSIREILKIFKFKLKFKIIFFMSFLQMFSGGILSPIIIIYANTEIGISEETIRLMFLPLAFFLAIFSLPFGRIVDKIGKTRSVKLSFLILSIVFYTIPFLKNLTFLVIFTLIVGICISILIPAWFSLVSRESEKKERGFAIGSVGTAQSLGFILGPIAGGNLYEYIGISSPFIFSALILTFCLFLSIIYLKE